MERVVIVGGGPAGCAAALVAAKSGVEVLLLERMDTLSGLSTWCGQLMGWGPRQEAKLMGGGDFFQVWESLKIDQTSDLGIPDGNLTWDVTKVEEATRRAVEAAGIKVLLRSRAVDVVMDGDTMKAVTLADGTQVTGDAFVDATGAGGSMGLCEGYGQGCALCGLKCTIFGDRVATSRAANVPDIEEAKPKYFSMNFVHLDSLSPQLRQAIDDTPGGYSHHKIVPEEFYEIDFTSEWAHPERPMNIRWKRPDVEVINVGFAKTFLLLPLKYIRRIPGFENAWMSMPLAADGIAVKENSYAPHEVTMKVKGLDNLFVGGLRVGVYSGGVPSIFTGELAGHNAARKALGRELLTLPRNTIQGFFLADINRGKSPGEWGGEGHVDPRWAANGFDIPRLTDYAKIKEAIQGAGLMGVYGKKMT
ncbi:MAG: FAD-dependent oxidoreductase [Chloroflexi bacterium]|nr:FAD-dependent oxidoreductase [Chloroflexota bacterium]